VARKRAYTKRLLVPQEQAWYASTNKDLNRQ